MADEVPFLVSGSEALTDPAKDRLGFNAFARRLAESIVNSDPVAGLVIGVNGPWGSGKSTFLNLVRHHLSEMPASKRPDIVSFNPWWFAGQRGLGARFLEQFEKALGDATSTRRQIRWMRDYLADAGASGLPYTGGFKLVSALLGRSFDDPGKTKREIERLLSRRSRKIVVFIDDIDRLTGKEIRELFPVVKSVADFPRTVYLLAIDGAVVARALDKVHEGAGGSYLEKIVQLNIDLPLADRATLSSIFLDQLTAIIRTTKQDRMDERHWTELYQAGVMPYLVTPRAVNLLVTALSMTYATVVNEVNTADFVALEALRLFERPLYDLIKRKQGYFAERARDSTVSVEKQDIIDFHKRWIGAPEKPGIVEFLNRDAAVASVELLFPYVRSARRGSLGEGNSDEWSRGLRVCSRNHFPTYFRFAFDPTGVSALDLDYLLACASDFERFRRALGDCVRENRLAQVLLRLTERSQDISVVDVPNVVASLFSLDDEQLRSPGGVVAPLYAVELLLSRLLERAPSEQRMDLLTSGFVESPSLHLIAKAMVEYGSHHGEFRGQPLPDQMRLVTADGLVVLKKLLSDRIGKAASDGVLVEEETFPFLLSVWSKVDVVRTREWIEATVACDSRLIHLLKRLGLSSDLEQIDAFKSFKIPGIRSTLSSLSDVIDSGKLMKRCEEVLKSEHTSEEDKSLLQLLLSGHPGTDEKSPAEL